MTVTAAIEQLFAQNNVIYSITEAHPSAAQVTTAKTIILQDGQGKLQLLLAADSILDIDALRHFSNRELKPINPADEQAICSRKQLQRLPTIPQFLGMEMIIDSRLLNLTEHKLDSGNEQNIINLSNDQLQLLIANSVVADIAVAESSLQSGALDDTHDIEQITTAVANFTQLRIKQRLQETFEFPPLPDTAQRIIKLRVDPNADIKDLTNIVESDPALAAQVVSWAASPYYAAPGKIKSVHDAVVRVPGFDLVLNLSLGLALGKTLNMPKDAAKGFTPYWQQAVYTATAVEALVGVIPPKERPAMGMAYLSGLLHNFGYLILAEVFPTHFSTICHYQ